MSKKVDKLYTPEEDTSTLDPPTLAEIKGEKSTETKTPDDMTGDLGEFRGYKKLTELRGVGPKTAEKLVECGFKNVMDLATARADEVAALMKVTYANAKAWVEEASEAVLLKMETVTAEDFDKDKKAKIIYFKTGSSSVNNLLGRFYCPDCYVTRKLGEKCKCCGSTKPTAFIGGGVPTTSITGASGRFASGKTQLGNDIIVDALTKYTCPKCYIILDKGTKCPTCGDDATLVEVGFVETEPDTFHLDRLREICGARKIPQQNWKNIHVCPAEQIPTAKAQFLQYKVIQKKIEQGHNIHLVIVDSFNARFRAGYSRSEMLPIRAREFAEHFHLMEYMASTYNLAWYLTCQVIAPPRPDQGLAMKWLCNGCEYYNKCYIDESGKVR